MQQQQNSLNLAQTVHLHELCRLVACIGEIVLLRDKIREIVNFLTAYEVSFIILKFKSLNNVTKLGLHTLQIVCIIRATRTQLSVSGAAVARNASSDKSHIMPSNTRCAAFVRSIIFACVAFPAAQCECRELRSFTSVTKLSLHRRIRLYLASRLTYSVCFRCPATHVFCCALSRYNVLLWNTQCSVIDTHYPFDRFIESSS